MTAPPENQNAVKGPAPATARIIMRVPPEYKNRWVKAAQREGKKLSEWIIERLNR